MIRVKKTLGIFSMVCMSAALAACSSGSAQDAGTAADSGIVTIQGTDTGTA